MFRGSVPTTSSHSGHTFSRAPQASIPRSKFNRSHGVKTTFDEGLLIPILVDEMLPGDTFHLKMSALCRMSTPIFPIMDNLYLETFFFAIPNRLLWDNWEKFNGYQVDPGDSTDFTLPDMIALTPDVVAEGSIGDYMGLPTKVTGGTGYLFSSLPFRAYNLIWNEWFRDENMQDSVTVQTGDSGDLLEDYELLRRGKRYDYFTSCLPFPQKGPDVSLPLGSTAPVVTTGVPPEFYQNGSPAVTGQLFEPAGVAPVVQHAVTAVVSQALVFDSVTGLETDLTTATAATINDLRQAFQTQKLYERDARGGTRYTEIIKSHFGVTSPDMRLQRPEYIGGGTTPITVNPVAQTSATSGSNALGDLAAYAVCAPHGHGFTYSATEHMTILGLVCVRADINYQQGLERMWSRQTRFDFYWPALSHLGEQAVLNREIFTTGIATVDTGDNGVFGYQERYAEYRYKPSQITGLFRSNATGTLDSWHLAQDFGATPELNDEFIVEDAPMDRILAVDTEPHFIFDGFFSYICARPMPVYAVPGLVDHF